LNLSIHPARATGAKSANSNAKKTNIMDSSNNLQLEGGGGAHLKPALLCDRFVTWAAALHH
jgi:hypothetical protein